MNVPEDMLHAAESCDGRWPLMSVADKPHRLALWVPHVDRDADGRPMHGAAATVDFHVHPREPGLCDGGRRIRVGHIVLRRRNRATGAARVEVAMVPGEDGRTDSFDPAEGVGPL